MILEETEKKIFDHSAEDGAAEISCPIKQVVLNAIEKIEQASRTKGSVTRNPDRIYGSGLQDLRYASVGSGSDRGPSVHGKDGVCTEYRPVYGFPQGCHGCDLQSGNVQGTAGEPSSVPWNPSVDSQNMRTGNLSRRGLGPSW